MLEKSARTQNSPMRYSKPILKVALDIGKEAVISEIAQKVGLSKKEVEDCLKNPLYQKSFADNCAEARKLDISGVPTFIVNGKYRITGAQPEETFIELFERVSETK